MSNIILLFACYVQAAKENCKAIRTGNELWSNIAKCRGHTKINKNTRSAFYNWITHYPQVVQYEITNGCLYVSIYYN